ncbi:MAG: response regulator [Pseudomonadota bacterium]
MKPILLIEDSPDDAELTIAALALDLSDRVVHVQDGKQALDWLHRRGMYANRPAENPAVILLDLNMPLVDGFGVLREIRENAALRCTPVVGLTSSTSPDDVVRAYSSGISAYVVKPIDFTEFVEAMKCIGQFWAVLNLTD